MSNVRVIYFLLAILVLSACKKDDDFYNLSNVEIAKTYSSEVVVDWYELIKTLTKETPGFTPPVAARAFGYIGIALYEGVSIGLPNKTSLSGKLNGLQYTIQTEDLEMYHWPAVANAILNQTTLYFYSNTSDERMEAIMDLNNEYTSKYQLELVPEVFEASQVLAKEVADNIIEWSETDGGMNGQFNNFPTDYILPLTASWKPTAPDFSGPLQPYWGTNRPFLLANVDAVQPVAPPIASTDENSLCYERATEVYNVVNNITSEQIKIAEFWSDDPVTTATPPGHSIAIANQLIVENNSNLGEATEIFAKLGIAISDAFISCWKTKYETLYVRPITYINENIDPNWEPILSTPPFPEYTSGHSVQSGALAEVMISFFGENYAFVDRTHEGRTDIDGTPRAYDSFIDMAEEAAVSRLYGGIHYQEAIYLGLEQGYAIGRNVSNLDLDN
ncbi:vanadium-dependent haloperoxidase [Maribacter aestuarii]|uniref:vanadium-dependent haloperoxidase n=1 Tax=Maribacter aestuarii TaxID=1130723 RepID=UPI0025A53B14|nr:vanadium-dependent haloperoxidase [Maribacter aestuarii]